MEEQFKAQSQLQKELDNSQVKTCVDIPGQRVIIFVTDKHLLICDKLKKQNQLLIPYAEFTRRFDNLQESSSETDGKAQDADLGEN